MDGETHGGRMTYDPATASARPASRPTATGSGRWVFQVGGRGREREAGARRAYWGRPRWR